MKSLYLLFTTSAIFIASAVSAQQFVNGSFESTKTNPGPCSYFHNAGIATFTDNAVIGSGPADNIACLGKDSAAISCVHGAAKDGQVYIALSANTTKYDVIAMKVDPALKAGTEYTLNYYAKSHLSPPVVQMTIGYATSSTATPTVITKTPMPAAGDTVWKLNTYKFTPTTAATWITLKAEITTFAGYSFLELDKFQLVGPTGISDVAANLFSISPNPAQNKVVINANTSAKTVQVNITDITGRVLYNATHVANTAGIPVDITNMPAGLYMIRVADGEHVSTQKLQIAK